MVPEKKLKIHLVGPDVFPSEGQALKARGEKQQPEGRTRRGARPRWAGRAGRQGLLLEMGLSR